VEFLVHADWSSPLDVVVTVTVLEKDRGSLFPRMAIEVPYATSDGAVSLSRNVMNCDVGILGSSTTHAVRPRSARAVVAKVDDAGAEGPALGQSTGYSPLIR